MAIAPVKATRLSAVERVRLDRGGVRENRRFFVIDARDRMVNSKGLGALQTVVSEYSDEARTLTLSFPDGRVVSGEVILGEPVPARFYSATLEGRLLEGPWSEALSEHVGRPLRIVEPDDEAGAVDRGSAGAVSLISRASLDRLAEIAGSSSVDGRRFRMLIEVDGVQAHSEDAWVGRSVRIGEAAVRFTGHVGRCLITSRNPQTGAVDLPTLDLLRSYRGELDSTEPLAFGIYGEVRVSGTIHVGDPVTVDGTL